MFKILKGFDDKLFFSLSSTELTGHDFKLYKLQANLDVRKYFFSNKVIDIWNSMPVNMVNNNMTDNLKKKFHCFFKVRGINKFASLLSSCQLPPTPYRVAS